MRCPHCGFENASSSTYCESCGAPQNFTQYISTSEFTEYIAPPPPTLNGHQELPPPPPSIEYEEAHEPALPALPALPAPPLPTYEMTSQLFANQKIISRPGPGIFSTLLYLIGMCIAALGLIGTIANTSTSPRVSAIALLLGIALLIVSIVVFIRLRHRFPILRWWQRILWILGATFAAFIALIVEVAVSPNTTVTNYFTGCVILVYGLLWAAVGVW